MRSDYALSGDYGDQLSLDGYGAVAGHQYRRKGGGSIVTVYSVQAGRKPRVRFRAADVERELPAEQFERDYEPFRL